MRRGAVGRAIRVAGLVLLLGLAVQLLLPPATGLLLTQMLRARLGAEGSVRVTVTSLPALELLLGRIDRLRIDARSVRLDALGVETLLADVRDLWVDMPALIQGNFVRRRQGEARARLVLTEEDLNRYLWTEVDPSRRFRIRLTPGGASLQGSFLGDVLPVRIDGDLILHDPTHIRFQPQRVSVREAQLPEPILRVLGDELIFPVDLADLPLAIGLDQLSLGDGWLVTTGSSEALGREEGRTGGT